MKRNMEIVLAILEFLEEREEISLIPILEIPAYDNDVVSYHCRRMYEAGLLDAEAVTSSSTDARLINVLPFGLTWQGHEFLDSMKNKTISEEVRNRLGGTLTDVPFILIKEMALSAGRNMLGL